MLSKWVGILGAIKAAGGLPHLRDVEAAARETLETKATATLATRAASWVLYRRWADQRGVPIYPFAAEVIHDYLRHAATAAPTRGQRFLESAAFARHLFRFDVEAAFGPRSRGIAAGGLKRKRATVKKQPFSAEDVVKMESMLVDFEAGRAHLATPASQMVCLGFVLFCIHARARFGDAARIVDEPTLDIINARGFIESRARPGRHKTSSIDRNPGKSLPLVACAFGVSGLPWTASWLELRARLGLHASADGSLMPEVLADWSFGAGRMPTAGGGQMIKKILGDVGTDDLGSYGTHSCKATLLSWAAKAGLSHDSRRLLGGHAAPGDRSVLQYSRDAMAAPMAELEGLLAKVRAKKFLPDVTRSGRWSEGPERDSSSSEASSGPAAPETSTSTESVAEEPPTSEHGFWINLRGKAHRAVSKDRAQAGCGYVFAYGAAKWATNCSGNGDLDLCRRYGCFQKDAVLQKEVVE